jgi:hypothetical protein
MNQEKNVEKLSPKFFFVSLGVIVSLITVVATTLGLFFETLNFAFPDALNSAYEFGYNTYQYDSMRATMATLIIVFPIFLVLTYFWQKLSRGALGSIDKTIRTWMIYLLVFLATVVIVVDLVTLVRYFVSGEITPRFIWKVVGTLFVAKVAGSYFLFSLKGDKLTKLARILYMILATLCVLLLIIFSFKIIGSPKDQRALRFDDRRVQDLQSIQWQVINFWQQKEKIPETISDLRDPISNYMIPVDPEFEKGNVYEYTKKGGMTFELCATFLLPMPEGWQEYGKNGVMPMVGIGGTSEDGRDIVTSYPYPGGMSDSWDHEEGRTCFERTIDKDVYPVYEKQ